MLRLYSIQWPIQNPYDKVAVELYFSGCYHGCKDCHNSYLKDFSLGEELNEAKYNELLAYLKEREGLFSVISFTGGANLS